MTTRSIILIILALVIAGVGFVIFTKKETTEREPVAVDLQRDAVVADVVEEVYEEDALVADVVEEVYEEEIADVIEEVVASAETDSGQNLSDEAAWNSLSQEERLSISQQIQAAQARREEVVEERIVDFDREEFDAADEVVVPSGFGEYVAYDEGTAKLAAADGTAVLFFHASWCPTCRRFDSELQSSLERLPVDTTVFKVNYDNESELKRKYQIRYQHTFVVVDENLNEVSKWSGGGVDTLLSNIQG